MTSFLALEVARPAAVRAIRIAHASGPRSRSIADQLIRSASSMALNLAEGAGRRGRDRANHYQIAYGSAMEAATAIEMLAAIEKLDRTEVAEVLVEIDRVRALTWRAIRAG